jgi:Zn-dependent protease
MGTSVNAIVEGALWYFVFLFSTVLHEAAHALAAHKLGDSTAYAGGQVTLNPMPHIRREPFGTVVIPILTYALGGWMMGWASAPYNLAWAILYPRRAALMSLAGPAANLLLMMVAVVGVRTGVLVQYFVPPEHINFTHVVEAFNAGGAAYVAKFLSILFSLNLLLCLFNLLPFPPLDGSGVIPLFLPEDPSRRYLAYVRRQPMLAFGGMYLAWKFFGFLYSPVHLFVINLLYPEMHYR